MDNNRKAIHSTLIYSTIFQFPLTKEELWHFAISKKLLNKDAFFHVLEHEGFIASQKGYYFLKGKAHLVDRRVSCISFTKRKYALARKISHVLHYIPSIRFIGITGSLAMENAAEDDDIDLFIITQDHTIWITRLCILFVLQLFGKRRKKHALHVRDMMCVNLFVEVSHVQVPPSSRNMYSAHEIAQVKPLYNKQYTFEKFLHANTWIREYMPNVFEGVGAQSDREAKRAENHSNFPYLVSFLNFLAKKLQLWYMTDCAPSAIISDTILAFYTGDMQKKVLREYEEGLKKYNVQ